jgi:hypothetical protein
MTAEIDVAGAGWLAARWAPPHQLRPRPVGHTSPVYLRPTAERARRQADSRFFVAALMRRATDNTSARFEHGGQRDRLLNCSPKVEPFERLSRD